MGSVSRVRRACVRFASRGYAPFPDRMGAVTVALDRPRPNVVTRLWVKYRVARILRIAQRQRHRCLRLQRELSSLAEAHPEVADEVLAVGCPVQTMARAPG